MIPCSTANFDDAHVAPIDFGAAARFAASVPEGRWTAYKDVAAAAGSPRGAQAIGDWLRRKGDEVPNVHRVLRADGFVPDAFRPAGRGVPADAERVRDLLREEGVDLDAQGRASQRQRFTVNDWRAD